MSRLETGRIIVGDARQVLGDLPESSVDCVVTSPPYFRLRNYQHRGQIGMEPTVGGWVDELRLVARGLARVLKPTGTFWLNLADTYARSQRDGAPPKSFVLAPERLVLGLVEDGWVLRNKIVWAKTNPMPTSTVDRLSCTWEALYCFAQDRHYFYDLDAIRVPHRSDRSKRIDKGPSWSVPNEWRAPLAGNNSGLDKLHRSGSPGHPLGKNPGDVWHFSTAGYRGPHHAVYPERLVETPLLAGCPEKVCIRCGRPWKRPRFRVAGGKPRASPPRPDCDCRADHRPGVALDPFIGSGTTAIVAERLGRDWIGIEINPDFADAATERIAEARSTGQAAA